MIDKTQFNHKLVILSLFIFFLAPGCQKDAGSGSYTFTNQTDRLVKILIYRTHADYIEGDYPVVSGSVQPHANYIVPIDAISESRSYYAEWYSDNFDYNNWADSSVGVQFVPTDNIPFNITSSEKNNIRKLCLSGNVYTTNWLAIDAFSDTSASSIWSQISDTDKYLKVQLTRRFNGIFDYKINHSVHDSITYTVKQDAAGIHVYFSGTSQVEMTSTSPPSTTNPNSIDTAWIHINGKKYLMLKQ
jgi:hypothetical protein